MSIFSFRTSYQKQLLSFAPLSTASPQELLKEYWGFFEFRYGQQEVISAVLQGKDVLAVMPTGAGKSLCYQLPALAVSGLTVIVSPLIALMKDQVGALKARGIPAEFVNSTLEINEISSIMDAVASGAVRILYIAPERFQSEDFVEIFEKLPVALFAIDEAHCVSQWGHDFRPDYMKLRERISRMRPRPMVIACTATATPEVKDDIIVQLGLKNPEVFVRGFDRPNLRWEVMQGMKNFERDAQILHEIRQIEGSGIVYAGTRDRAEEIARMLVQHEVQALPYHAGMDSEARRGAQDAFMSDRARVIVATVAFGMGIDKPDVRFVIHGAMPGSLEAYYQEAGRAGRDGKPARCLLLHSWADKNLQEFFIKKAFKEMIEKGKGKKEAERYMALRTARLERMTGYVTTRQCRRRKILEYFGDPDASRIINCKGCDMCQRAS